MDPSAMATSLLRGAALSSPRVSAHLREHAKARGAGRAHPGVARAAQPQRAARRQSNMKVRDLITILEGLDADADVFVMSQQGYAFEHAVAGVAVREDFTEGDEEDDDGEEAELEERRAGDRWTARPQDLPSNDVFILEGRQLRYGCSDAWRARR
jgi:hypothetical protein